MTQDARARHLAAGPEVAEALGGADVVLEKLWHALTSMRFAMLLILAFAVVAFIGTLVIQAPAGVAGDTAAKADWLDAIRPKYGGWTAVMDQLQLFTIFSSVWLKAIAVLLTTSLVACAVHRLPGTYRTAMQPNVEVGEAFFEHAPQHETITSRRSRAEVQSALRAVFGTHRYRLIAKGDTTIHVYADRNRFSGFASQVGHLAPVVILVGVIVGTIGGFRDSQFMIAEGASVAVPTRDGMTLTLQAFRDSYYVETSAPADYASDVIVRQDGQEVQRHTIRVNDPLVIGDISFYQSFYGAAAQMVVADGSGRQVVAEGVPLAWSTDDGARKVGTLVIPSAGLTAWVVGTAGSDDPVVKPGQMRVELYRSSGDGAPVAQVTIDQGKPTEIEGLTFTFLRETQFTGLSVVKDPGVMVVWLGALLLVAGFTLVFLFPHRRIWARIATGPDHRTTVALASASRRDVTLGTEFADIVVAVRAALAAPRQA